MGTCLICALLIRSIRYTLGVFPGSYCRFLLNSVDCISHLRDSACCKRPTAKWLLSNPYILFPYLIFFYSREQTQLWHTVKAANWSVNTFLDVFLSDSNNKIQKHRNPLTLPCEIQLHIQLPLESHFKPLIFFHSHCLDYYIAKCSKNRLPVCTPHMINSCGG